MLSPLLLKGTMFTFRNANRIIDIDLGTFKKDEVLVEHSLDSVSL